MILEKINSPKDLKALGAEELQALSGEIRNKLIETVSQNGGHLAANLCVVELTVAIHRVFDSPKDKIIFDVGHQSYVHKLLTGRREEFDTLRQTGGISGFPKRSESEHDAFGAGHSSTSVSAAAGIAAANSLCGNDSYTVAIVGDGAFTGGMIYEALNNCADKEKLIIVLNDNDMSISPNVGGMSRYFSKVRTSAKYFSFKNRTKRFFKAIPLVGNGMLKLGTAVKNRFKKLVMSQNFFEQFGLSYYGPVDGNDIKHLERVLNEAKDDKKCAVVHVCTTKGKGYKFAEERPDLFHGVSGFDIESGKIKAQSGESFSERFGSIICKYAEKDQRIAAITAAMPDGTGLSEFAKRFPERFFDVGIAEEHALTFACGLAVGGIIPVFAVYSTFVQRAFDQLIHDAALQNLHVIIMLDRAGLVANDGATHHGIFDTAFISEIPNVTLYSPNSFDSLEKCFADAIDASGPIVIRYPKSGDIDCTGFYSASGVSFKDFGVHPENAVITYGRLQENACLAAESLQSNGKPTRVISLTRLSPLPTEDISKLLNGIGNIVFAEEGIKNGGVSQRLCAELTEKGLLDGKRVRIKAVDGVFPDHGSNKDLLNLLSLSHEAIISAFEEE
ncbi:MAG: 1-deoxy-D-xylulose-5-phosphate synthase [Clostridia bacterium]|nr:1-deoxy-D-xylulose-5-phosphate synthase [Clostridia bacterium]